VLAEKAALGKSKRKRDFSARRLEMTSSGHVGWCVCALGEERKSPPSEEGGYNTPADASERKILCSAVLRIGILFLAAA
jgi:hypothetical protein